MQRISTSNLHAGLVVARDVLSADGNVLLRRGIILTDQYIKRLITFNVYSVYIKSPYFDDILIPEAFSEQTRIMAIKTVKENFLKLQMNKNMDLAVFTDISNSIINEVINNRKLMVNLIDIRAYDDYTFGHSVNVAILAVFIGIGMGYGETKLKELALGGLLHDVGKMFIPKEILNKQDKLTDNEMKVMKGHSLAGFELLRQNKEISLLSAHIAFQHHEKLDGSGYPRGLQGTEIHEYASIIAVADVYDALTSDRPYRRGMLPHEAYEILSDMTKAQIDEDILDMLFTYVAIYPVGSLVQLNTGKIGVVVDVRRHLPLRPKVRIVLDDCGKTVNNGHIIDLEHRSTHFITKVFKEEERIAFPLNKY
jgi:HD-GYP domain-containing protein (c-di-GMP phosphodiesterase class II)